MTPATKATTSPDRDKIIYVLGVCEQLESKGLIRCGHRLKGDGRTRFAELKAAGFTVSPEDVQDIMRCLVDDSAGVEAKEADDGQ